MGALGDIKVVTDVHYDLLQQNDIEINSFFKYKEKFIFAPYSQFVIKQIYKEGLVTVVEL